MKSKLFVAALVAALLAGVVAPSWGSHASAAPAAPVAAVAQGHAGFLDKTRFLAHVGLAYYAFHHWVYAPYKKEAFASGAPGRVKAIAKAALAVAFTYHELKVAYGIANKSKSATLRAVVAPLNALMSKANATAARLKAGHYSNADIQGLNSATTSLSAQAQKNSMRITDVKPPTPVPGLS